MTTDLESAPLDQVLRWAVEKFHDGLRIASSFGVEDMIVLHEAVRIGGELGVAPRVFLLDTGRLHQETYDLVDRVRAQYGIAVDVYFPEAALVEDLVRRKGPNGFYASAVDRRECCAVRKVRPLARALDGAAAWVTGMRREQSTTRQELSVFQYDEEHGGIVKLSPLAHWTTEAVWDFARRHRVPTHALHDQGYPSIGCAPCTRPIESGEDIRAGRWWWESPDHKECGLHPRARTRAQKRAS